MNTEENRNIASTGKVWQVIVTMVAATAIPVITFFAINGCDNLLLKSTVIAFLIICFIISVYFYNQHMKGRGMILFLGYVFLFLLYFIFSIIVWTKKCEEPKKEPAKEEANAVAPDIHIDNSTVDKSKHYPTTTEQPRKLNKEDIKKLNKNLPDKTGTIYVQYLASRSVDTLLFHQIVSYLNENGYEDVRESPVSTLPMGRVGEKIWIWKGVISEKETYKVIINPPL